MKNIIYTILLIAFCHTSCTNDILDKEPLDIISDGNVWNDPALMDLYINGIYTELPWLLNEFEFLSEQSDHSYLFTMMDISDETKPNWYQDKYKYKSGNLTVNGGLLDWWGYSAIRKMNVFLERVPDSPYDEDVKIKRIAEVRFLRAFSYFAMVKRYGGVPLITKVQSLQDTAEELNPKRDKEEAIYDFILSEINDIVGVLPDNWSSDEYGRPTKFAALALKSRAAMYAASIAQWGNVQLDGIVGIPQAKAQYYWLESYNASMEIVNSNQFTLYNNYPNDKVLNYQNIFLDERNSETIFSKQYTGKGGTSHNWEFFQIPVDTHAWGGGNQSGPYLEMVESYEYIDGTSGKLNESDLNQLWTMEELWGNKDPRFKASIYTQNSSWQGDELQMYNGIIAEDGIIVTSGSYNGIQAVGKSLRWKDSPFGVMKFIDEGGEHLWNNYSDNDWLIFRYGEIILNLAEAALELGKDSESLDAINQIRERAGMALLSEIDKEKIRHERKIELAFEGHRYWDLRRWRIATDTLTHNFSTLRYFLDYKTKKFQIRVVENVHGTTTPPVFYEKNYYLPITNGRIAKSPNLVENPGY